MGSFELCFLNFQTIIQHGLKQPIHFEGNVLFVELPNEFTRDWVDARYAAPLRKTLRHVVNKEWDLKLVIPSGVKPVTDAAKPQAPQDAEPTTESPSQAPSSSESPNQEQISSVLNPRYTFDTFVVGNSNRFTSLKAVIHRKPTTRCSCTEEWD